MFPEAMDYVKCSWEVKCGGTWVNSQLPLNCWESVSNRGHSRLCVNKGCQALIMVCTNSCVLELRCAKPEKIHVTAWATRKGKQSLFARILKSASADNWIIVSRSVSNVHKHFPSLSLHTHTHCVENGTSHWYCHPVIIMSCSHLLRD